MKYNFKYAKHPPISTALRKEIEAAAERLAKKLQLIDVRKLSISEYNKRYFGEILKNIPAALQLRSFLIGWVLSETDIPKEKIVLVDYGGGSGMLSLLAKELGMGTVIYDDIYDVSCRDAAIIAKELGIPAEHYVNGDIDELIDFVKQQKLSVTSLASYDVLEHIYDVPLFINKLPKLSDGPLNIVMGSGANMKNPLFNKIIVKRQLEMELQDRPAVFGAKDRDALKSYKGIRREMIQQHLQKKNLQLKDEEINELAKRTRGFIQNKIEHAVDNYISLKQLPQELEHPTNTCDPNNGNWAEHLMDTKQLARDLANAGFKSKIISGYYGDSNHPFKRLIGRCLNFIISKTGNSGLYFAGFYILSGVRKSS